MANLFAILSNNFLNFFDDNYIKYHIYLVGRNDYTFDKIGEIDKATPMKEFIKDKDFLTKIEKGIKKKNIRKSFKSAFYYHWWIVNVVCSERIVIDFENFKYFIQLLPVYEEVQSVNQR